jgi:hypothetical protein
MLVTLAVKLEREGSGVQFRYVQIADQENFTLFT